MSQQDIIAAAVKAAMEATLNMTVSNFQVPTVPKFPEHFRTDPARTWKEWKSEWDSYVVCSKLDSQPQDVKLHTFLTAIGREGRIVYKGLQFESEDKKGTEHCYQKIP